MFGRCSSGDTCEMFTWLNQGLGEMSRRRDSDTRLLGNRLIYMAILDLSDDAGWRLCILWVPLLAQTYKLVPPRVYEVGCLSAIRWSRDGCYASEGRYAKERNHWEGERSNMIGLLVTLRDGG